MLLELMKRSQCLSMDHFSPVWRRDLISRFSFAKLQTLWCSLCNYFSAILFGIYHGNIVQTPFAFILGLLLGYITVSYGLKYAIAVHIFNNMVLADFQTVFTVILRKYCHNYQHHYHGKFSTRGTLLFISFWHTQRQKLFAPIDYSVIRSALFNLPFMILLVICLLEMLAGLTPLH